MIFPLISLVFLKEGSSVAPTRSLRNTKEIKGKVIKMKIKSISGGVHGSKSLSCLSDSFYIIIMHIETIFDQKIGPEGLATHA